MVIGIDSSEITRLFKTVVDRGYCIGCGACASLSGSPIHMKLDDYGRFQANWESSTSNYPQSTSVQAVCPFSGEGANEDQIARELFGNDCEYHNKIGYHLNTYAGYVSEGNFRDRGSSGGMGTWIVSQLLKEGLVDGVIHVYQRAPSDQDPRLFHYQLSTKAEQVRNGAKSRYYPIEISEVMQLVREHPGRYAIVGIPCFIKAVRLLMQQDLVIAERIRFCIGLICGHLKSMRFAEMFAWQCGIEPDQLLSIDFRKKLLGADANSYGIEVTGLKDGQVTTVVKPVRDLYGSDWGLGFFKYKACDYCDDVVAETADVVVGDAWLPQYIKDSQGTNVIVTRSPIIQDLLERGIALKKLKLESIEASEVARSQSAGLRHRREGLAYRLYIDKHQGKWYPPKRVQPSKKHLNSNLQKRQVWRSQLACESHFAFKKAVNRGQFSLFVRQMEPLVKRYKSSYQTSQKTLKGNFIKHIEQLVKRFIKSGTT